MKTARAIKFPQTEGIKYAGSKRKLLPYILRLAERTGARSVFDGFSGTTRVSQAFARTGWRVIANDTAVWSRTFGICYLKNEREPEYYAELVEHLNSLPGKNGWFTENYGGASVGGNSVGTDGLKKPFQSHNTKKLDAIRDEIDRLELDEPDKCVLLTSLILALDKVDSTIGHHSSYLKRWSARSYGKLEMRVPDLIPSNNPHEVLNGDIFEAAPTITADLAYLDPPYGSNNELMPPSRVRYNAYYHLWTTVVLNDRPGLFGKAKRRCDSSDTSSASVFEEFRRNEDGTFIAVEALGSLLRSVRVGYVILSYSSGGRANSESLIEMLRSAGDLVEVVEIDHKKNVMASMSWTGDWVRSPNRSNTEFLFLLKK